MSTRQKIIAIGVSFLLCAGALYLFVVTFGKATVVEPFVNPHGNYDVADIVYEGVYGTDKCGKCHGGHSANSLGLLRLASQRQTCYACHGDEGQAQGLPNARYQFGEVVIGESVYSATGSLHPVPTGQLLCTNCHDPHLATEDTEGGTASLLSVGESKVSSGNEVCWVCHGPGSTNPGGDMKTDFETKAHDTMAGPASGTQITCARCHQPHGSPYDSLLRTEIGGNAVTGNNKTLCEACHSAGLGNYSGAAVYNLSAHGDSERTTSTVALTVYPGIGYSTDKTGACLNCHEPHGKTGVVDYKRAEGRDLCVKCHDDPSVEGTVYSYRGIVVYNNSGHNSAEASYSSQHYYTTVNTVAYETYGDSDPVPSSLSGPVSAAVMSPAALNDVDRWITGLAGDGQYNYQIYKFPVAAEAADIRRFNITWTGYGEPTTGYMTDLKLWNGTAWQQLDSKQLGGPSDGTLSGAITSNFANYLDADGYVTLLARARHDGTAPTITEGPVVTKLDNITAQIHWHTNEPATSRVDYGTTPAYEQIPFNDATLLTEHTVVITNLTGLTTGTNWYFRVRSTDALTNEVIGADDYMEFKTPSLTAGPTVTAHDGSSATIQFTASENTTAYVDYGISTAYGSSVYDGTLSTSHTVTLTGMTGLTTGTNYYYRIRLYDQKNNTTTIAYYTLDYSPPSISAISPADGFTITGNSVTITWTTNESATTNVDYGLIAPGELTATVAGTRTSHSVALNNLQLNRTYHYRIRSVDARGNEATSAERTFIVPPNNPPTAPAIIAPLPADNYGLTTPISVTLYWQGSSDPESNPITYVVKMQSSLGGTFYMTTTNTSMQVNINNSWAVTWTWQVGARDAYHTADADINWSGTDSFVHEGPHDEDSCTFAPIYYANASKIAALDLPSNLATVPWQQDKGYFEMAGQNIKLGAAAVRRQVSQIAVRISQGISRYKDRLSRAMSGPGSEVTTGQNDDTPVNIARTAEPIGKPVAFTVEPYLYGGPILFRQYGDTHYSLNTNFVDLEVMASSSSTLPGDCVICHAAHGQLDGSGNLIPKQLKLTQETLCFSNGYGCHTESTNSVQQISISSRFNSGAGANAHHSISAAEGGKIQCVNCHDPHINSAANRVINPENRYGTGYNIPDADIPKYISDADEAYVLVEGKVYDTGRLFTDQIFLNMNTVNATGSYKIDDNGLAWESGGLVKPVPVTSPGTPITPGTQFLDADSVYWNTYIGAHDQYNYQMFRFPLDASKDNVRTMALTWRGYTGTTGGRAGYDVNLYLWNSVDDGGRWDSIGARSPGSLGTVNIYKKYDFISYCNKCHDNSLPYANMNITGVREIAVSYNNDAHGASGGPNPRTYPRYWDFSIIGYGQSTANIKTPYQRSNAALSCNDCHDPHGSSMIYHFRENLNGTSGNTTVTEYCQSCHTGGPSNYHASCLQCHTATESTYHGGIPTTAAARSPSFQQACTNCHKHGGTWTHPGILPGCNDSTGGYSSPTHCGTGNGAIQTF